VRPGFVDARQRAMHAATEDDVDATAACVHGRIKTPSDKDAVHGGNAAIDAASCWPISHVYSRWCAREVPER